MTDPHNPYLQSVAPRSAPLPLFQAPGYDLEELLGVGGCGQVWRARARANGESVAVKYIPIAAREQAQTEAAMLQTLHHPHLIRLREVLELSGAVAFVLDLAERGSLDQLLQARGRLSPGEAITAVAPVAAAVAYAHSRSVVHGDITAANVVFNLRGDALLTDLGTARLVPGDDPSGAAARYAPYLPTTADDVYALGALAFRTLTGTEPGSAEDQRRALSMMPSAVADVLTRALSPETIMRGSAADFALDLRSAGVPAAVEFLADGPWPSGPARPAPTRASTVLPRPQPAVRSRSSRRQTPRRPKLRLPRLPARKPALIGLSAVIVVGAGGLGFSQLIHQRAGQGDVLTRAQAQDVLSSLETQRQRAYTTQDPTVLDAVYLPGPALDEERGLVEVAVKHSCALTGAGIRYAVRSVTEAIAGVAEVRTDLDVAAGQLRCKDTDPPPSAAYTAEGARVVLTHTPSGWLIASVTD